MTTILIAILAGLIGAVLTLVFWAIVWFFWDLPGPPDGWL